MKLKAYFVRVLLLLPSKSSTALAFDVRCAIDAHSLFRFPIIAKASVDEEALSSCFERETEDADRCGTNDAGLK